MLLPKFDYQVPKSLREACALLDEYGAKAKLLAGGTDLLVNLKRKTLAPEQVISLNKIKGLDEAAAKKGKGISIGPLATAAYLAENELAQGPLQVLAEGAGRIGSPLIRNRATIGGNIVTARPASDLAPPLLVLGAFLILSAARPSGPFRRFDFVGFLSFSAFLGALLVAFSQGQRQGWGSDYIIFCFGISFLGLISFIVSGLLIRDSIIDLRIFLNYNFVLSILMAFSRSAAAFGSMFLLPLFLQNLLEYKALSTGIILLPTAVSVAIVSPFSGLITDRMGPRIPLVSGVFLMAYSLYLYKDISLGSDYWFLVWPQVLRGIGIGLVNAPLMSTALNAIRREQMSIASGVFTVMIQVGGAFSVAMLGTVLQRREFFHYATYLQQIHDAFSPAASRALATMQDLLLTYGHGTAAALAKGKTLLAHWVLRQATVASFQDAFVVLALWVIIGIFPALLIRKVNSPGPR